MKHLLILCDPATWNLLGASFLYFDLRIWIVALHVGRCILLGDLALHMHGHDFVFRGRKTLVGGEFCNNVRGYWHCVL